MIVWTERVCAPLDVLRAHNCYCCITARLFSYFFIQCVSSSSSSSLFFAIWRDLKQRCYCCCWCCCTFFPDVPSFHFIFAWFFFVPRNVQLLLAVCIVENEGGDFRKTMCNELFLWPRIYAHHFWWWHFLFVFVSLIIHDRWRHDVITHFFRFN